MDERFAERLLMTAAAVALVLGIVLCARTAVAIRYRSGEMAICAANHEEVLSLRDAATQRQGALVAFEGLSSATAEPLDDALRRLLPDQKYEARDQHPAKTPAGWTMKKREISMPDAPLSKVAAFLQQVESQRPPWRLTSCSIRAAGVSAGSGQVTIVLESLSRQN